MRRLLSTTILSASLALAANKPKIDVPVILPASAEAASKVVQVGDRDVIPITTRMRFTTMIVLPKEETILDFVCGDKEFWVINGSQNFAFIKPARENGQTNLNLITASGNVYSFTLTEGGEATKPDLKVFVEPKGSGLLASISGQPRFVPVQAVDDYKEQLRIAQSTFAKAREEADAQIAAAQQEASKKTALARAAFPASMSFDYKYSSVPEFAVAAIYHDDKFTYIRANPQETPSLYEIKDDKPSLIQFQYADGLYTVPKLVDRGYLSIGKKKMHFAREPK